MQKLFMVSRNDQNQGPFSREEILRRFSKGELAAENFVFVEDRTDWVTLLEFFPEVTPQPLVQTQPAQAPSKTPPKFQGKTLISVVVDEPRPSTPLPKPMPPPAFAGKPFPAQTVAKPTPERKTQTPPPQPQQQDRVQLQGKPYQPEKQQQQPLQTAKQETTLQKGVVAVDFVHNLSGEMELRLRVKGGKNVSLPAAISIFVKAGPAERISMKGAHECKAGETEKFKLEASDAFGNLDLEFAGTIGVSISGSAKAPTRVVFEKGCAEVPVSNNKAETVHIELKDVDNCGVDVSASCKLIVHPGQTTRFEVIPPEVVIAGRSAKFIVKALDAYGNIATDFDGAFSLESDSKSKAA